MTAPRARRVDRRTAMLAGFAALVPALPGCAPQPIPQPTPTSRPTPGPPPDTFGSRLAEIEARFGRRIGVHALATGTGAVLAHRADDRFLMCSTAKAPTVAAVLRRAQGEPDLLERRIRWTPEQIVRQNSPVARRDLATGATVAALCDAALTVSDNTAQNLLLDLVGGPAGVTTFVRAVGDATTRFDRPEPDLNVGAPGDERDTTTPAAMTATLRALVLGDALALATRERLEGWMRANRTGDRQIRAGVPTGWVVADKTGGGPGGESNDVGVVRPPDGAPIVLALYTVPDDPANGSGPEAIAAASSAVVEFLPGAR